VGVAGSAGAAAIGAGSVTGVFVRCGFQSCWRVIEVVGWVVGEGGNGS